MTTSKKADLMLFIEVTFWGFSFYFTAIASRELAPFTLNAFRFILAFLLLALLMQKKLRHVTRATVIWSFFLGMILAIMYTCNNISVANTTLSNSGFLCQLTVIVTPILSGIVQRKMPERKIFLASFLCLIGIALLTLKKGFQPNPDHLLGDAAALICGIIYAVQIVATEYAVKKTDVDPLQLSILELGFTGTFSLFMSFFFEDPALPASGAVWGAVLFLGLFCTGFAFVLQTLAQQYTSASHASIILSLEPVINAFVAFFLAGELLLPRAYIGAGIMIFSIFFMEVDWKELKKQHEKHSRSGRKIPRP